jgi:hypothetical protein
MPKLFQLVINLEKIKIKSSRLNDHIDFYLTVMIYKNNQKNFDFISVLIHEIVILSISELLCSE